jgi:hypothetical protein
MPVGLPGAPRDIRVVRSSFADRNEAERFFAPRTLLRMRRSRKEGRWLRAHGDGVARGVQQLAGILADIPVSKHGIARDQQFGPGSDYTTDRV